MPNNLDKFHTALGKKFDKYTALFTFEQVRASLTSGTGAFLFVDAAKIRVSGKNPAKRRTVSAMVVINVAPNYDHRIVVGYKMVYNGKKYNATIKEIKLA